MVGVGWRLGWFSGKQVLRFGSTEIWIYVFACDFGCVERVLTGVLGFCFVGLVLCRLCG